MLRRPDRHLLKRHLVDAAFLITERAGEIDAALIGAARQLRLIQRLGSLTYDIDLAAAKQAGIAVCTWPIRGCVMVAEHLILQMLALAKKLGEVQAIAHAASDWGRPSRRTDENTFAYNWSGRNGIGGLYNATVGILGFGEIGAELARRLAPFQPAQVLYHKRRRLPADVEAELGLSFAAYEELIAASDFLCSLLPFYPETDQSLNAAVFSRMKPGALLVHCGSGSVIDELALAQAVAHRQLGGAALDTYEWEPLRPDNPLLSLAREPQNNLLLTPHTAAGTPIAGAHSRSNDYTNLIRLLKGESLLYQVA